MENQENGQTDDRIPKLVRVLDQILPSVGYSPNPLRVEEIDEVREDRLSDLNTPPPPESPLHELQEYPAEYPPSLLTLTVEPTPQCALW